MCANGARGKDNRSSGAALASFNATPTSSGASGTAALANEAVPALRRAATLSDSSEYPKMPARSTPARLAALAAGLLAAASAQAQPSKCSAFLTASPPGGCVAALTNTSLNGAPASPARAADLCFALCTVCTDDDFIAWQLGAADGPCAPAPPASGDAVVAALTDAALNTSALHGQYFLDDQGDIEENATQAIALLLGGMARRDLLLLASDSLLMLDVLVEHVRYALHTRAWSSSMNVSWAVFADNVLPYSMLDEKRDLFFRWRPRFSRVFRDVTAGAASITEAMQRLAVAVPQAQTLGLLSNENGGELDLVPGQPISWRSSVSPAFISVEQVASFGGSCTGTGIVLVAAARAVGIPARLAGCGESIVRHDDHHWIEFWDGASPGPFGDFWHTKEGTSAGNEGGPWDSPSGPMLGCLAGVVPYSAIDSLWAASWSSPVYMPMLWSNDTWSSTWSFVGGLDRCGAYCKAWGCGVNNSNFWTQAQCSQYAD